MDFKYQTDGFSLKNTLECGQCFRWKKLSDGSFFGVVGNHSLRVEQKESTVVFMIPQKKNFSSCGEFILILIQIIIQYISKFVRIQ